MAPKLHLVGTFVSLLISSFNPAIAQVGTPDPDARQVVGLFQQSCIRFAGNSAALRDWISAHHLPQVLEAQAAVYLGSIGTGEVFAQALHPGSMLLSHLTRERAR